MNFRFFFFAILAILVAGRSLAQSPCENGFAGIYECDNVDLLAHVSPAEIGGATTNEVWGWTDPLDSNEYVILGASTGVFFYDIANPSQPLLLGNLPTHTTNSTWRTFRTYQNFLFIASEADGHGMQVFDLTRLRNVDSPPQLFTEDAHYDLFGDCHTLAICEETGMAYACGTNTYSGSIHIVNIQDPLNPQIAGGYTANGYTHEAQVVVYNGPDQDYAGKTIAFCYNGSVEFPLTIVDVTNPDDASTISTSTYPGKRYCHQGWLTEDQRYLLVNDELDEYYNYVDSLHTIIFDVQNLDEPVYMGYHAQGTAIDHNTYIRGNLAFMSHYTDGLNIMDISMVSDTVINRIAYFDHFTDGDPELFQGEWLNYPFFKSGVVPVSDIYNGMFLLKPNLMRAAAPESFCASDGFDLEIELFPGFHGPYEIIIDGLPEGVQFELPSTIPFEPGLLSIPIFSTELLNGQFSFTVTVHGEYFSFTSSVLVLAIPPVPWYGDEDGDNFGTDEVVIFACDQPFGFAPLAGDCDESNPMIFPGAPASGDGIDNDCSGALESDELPMCADLDEDGLVDVDDLYLLSGDYGCSGMNCIGDINLDGMTDMSDLFIFLADFGEFCPE